MDGVRHAATQVPRGRLVRGVANRMARSRLAEFDDCLRAFGLRCLPSRPGSR